MPFTHFPLQLGMELPPFLLLTILLMFTSYPEPVLSRRFNNVTDLESLLAFKAHVTDPFGILATNWTTNTSFCMWTGVSCSRRHQRVTAIRLMHQSLHGTISPHLANLSFLSVLVLDNDTLIGPIPEALGRLRRLTVVTLQDNLLSGPIPSAIFNISSLTEFYVTSNNLSGYFSSNDSRFMLPRLQYLSLSSNSFTGQIPSSFSQSQDLKGLSLTYNQFSGTIPVELGSLPELTELFLGYNQLTGEIPTSLGNLTKLIKLELMMNNLTGVIPRELGKLPNLQRLNMPNNNLTGSIPTSLLNDSNLYFLDLALNKLSGSVPDGTGKSLPLLEWFNVGGNQLTGGLEFLSSLSNCKKLKTLQIFTNMLEGVIPDSIGNLSKNLQFFNAWGNQIKGNIPAGLGNLSGLIYLDLEKNELTGKIPSTLTKLETLQQLSLGYNRISGSIPFQLGLLTNLNVLSIQHNALSGPIPDSLANISFIQYLLLGGNKLSASVPQSLLTRGSLLVLDLSANTLSGPLPPQVGNLNALIFLNLSMNRLSGNISSALGELQMLQYLDLSTNAFQGQIPESFGEFISVIYLNLSYNSLSEYIPKSLAKLPYLESLDLSFNLLEGEVPEGRVFSNLSIVSLMGNRALCGPALLGFPPCSPKVATDNSRGVLQSLKYILPATVSTMVFLAFLCLIYKFKRRWKIKAFPISHETYGNNRRVIPHSELVCATSNFSEANLLGRGCFGSVFKGCLDDGLSIAVKVFNLEVQGALESFDAECQVLKLVRHRNLIKIISVCSNLDFKALILQYMPNGNLDQWLYFDNYYLTMLQRLNIMVDISLALEHLHHHHSHIVLHCDLKPGNVLLDDEMVAHLSDFGIAKLLLGDSRSVASASVLGTVGYIAPECASNATVSRMCDVYSFGILLLETFTGKRPTDAMFGGELSLREWTRRAHPTAIPDVMDTNLLKDHSTDEGTTQNITAMHQCLSSVIELGLLCSSYSPEERIQMTDVVVRLQKIKMEYL